MTDPVPAAPDAAAPAQQLAEALDDVEQQFAALYSNAQRGLRRRAAAVHPELLVTGYRLLGVLSHRGALQQVEIAELLELDKAVVSRTVKQLEELGLVGRTPDPHDGRASRVALSPEADERLRSVNEHERAALRTKLSDWHPDEIGNLAALLARLNEPA